MVHGLAVPVGLQALARRQGSEMINIQDGRVQISTDKLLGSEHCRYLRRDCMRFARAGRLLRDPF